MPTSRNARGIDIVAYDSKGESYIGVQVKALSKKNPVPLGNSLDKVMGDYWVVVNNVSVEPNVYILLPQEVKNLARRTEKEGRVAHWLQPTDYAVPEFYNAWDRIKSVQSST